MAEGSGAADFALSLNLAEMRGAVLLPRGVNFDRCSPLDRGYATLEGGVHAAFPYEELASCEAACYMLKVMVMPPLADGSVVIARALVPGTIHLANLLVLPSVESVLRAFLVCDLMDRCGVLRTLKWMSTVRMGCIFVPTITAELDAVHFDKELKLQASSFLETAGAPVTELSSAWCAFASCRGADAPG